jgi:Uma2 family endonuclease
LGFSASSNSDTREKKAKPYSPTATAHQFVSRMSSIPTTDAWQEHPEISPLLLAPNHIALHLPPDAETHHTSTELAQFLDSWYSSLKGEGFPDLTTFFAKGFRV